MEMMSNSIILYGDNVKINSDEAKKLAQLVEKIK